VSAPIWRKLMLKQLGLLCAGTVCLLWTRDPSRATPRLFGLTGVRWPQCILRKGSEFANLFCMLSSCRSADSSATETVPAAAMQAAAGVSLRTFTVYTISDRSSACGPAEGTVQSVIPTKPK
jgi:hypothetical protein